MARPDSTKDNLTEIPHLRNEPRPDFNDRLPKVALPKEISSTLDNDEKFMDLLYEGKYVEPSLVLASLMSSYLTAR